MGFFGFVFTSEGRQGREEPLFVRYIDERTDSRWVRTVSVEASFEIKTPATSYKPADAVM
jgi:hypothetical protein